MEEVNTAPATTQSQATNYITSSKWHRTKAKMLSAYYGKPIEDLRLIAIVGKNSLLTAQMLHCSLVTNGHHAKLLDLTKHATLSSLHKFLSEAWKTGANFVIIATSEQTLLTKDIFYGLTIESLIFTSEIANQNISHLTNFCQDKQNLLLNTKSCPDKKLKVTLWRDNLDTPNLDQTLADALVITCGTERGVSVRISNVRRYKKGIEATISYGSDMFSVATFDTSDESPAGIVATAATLISFGFTSEEITNGLSEWPPAQ